MPAISPPTVIAPSERPATRKPTAAPGRIAHAIASPVRLMRRSIRKTPTGVAPTETAMHPISARRMKPKSAKGWTRSSHIMPLPSGFRISKRVSRPWAGPFPRPRCHPGLDPGSRATGTAVARLPWTPDQVRGDNRGARTAAASRGAAPADVWGAGAGLAHLARAELVFGGQHLRRGSVGDELARQHQRAGEVGPHRVRGRAGRRAPCGPRHASAAPRRSGPPWFSRRPR